MAGTGAKNEGKGDAKRRAAKKAKNAASTKASGASLLERLVQAREEREAKDMTARPTASKPAAEASDSVAKIAAPVSFAQPPTPSAAPDHAREDAAKGSGGADSRAQDDASPPMPDFEALSTNMAQFVEEAGKALAAYVKPFEKGDGASGMAENVGDAVKTLGHIAVYWLADPKRSLEAQTSLSGDFFTLWATTLRRFSGEQAPAVVESDPGDKRFADPEWRSNPMFDFLRQAYTLSSRWINDLVDRADVDEATRARAQFYARQVTSALSPSNFVVTNPEIIRETIKRNGANLVRGMTMLAEDIEAGKGRLKVRQTDASKFQLGVDMAATPGKVVFRNDLMELIQYTPTTERVYRRPLLIAPPWINKFYILDLNPEKSFIRWAVSQGVTVFVISWVNPDERHAGKTFEDYMREGIFAALDAVEAATGERRVNAVGYCVGGTLLSVALAYMAQANDDRIASATLLTTQVDFRDAGDLKHFVDEARVRALEGVMNARGFLEGSSMSTAFNLLRPTELFWNYVVDNYLKGKDPTPFDLLAWNSDSTRMPAANHSFYLRNCYLENSLSRGEMEIAGVKLDLGTVTIPIYNLATKEDHIAPARSVYTGARLFGGPMRYVLAGSGHIAGVVNPASKPKYQFWTGPQPRGASFEDWLLAAQETKGTWWIDWLQWLVERDPEQVDARTPGEGSLKPLGDAPGDYVRVKA